MSILDQIDAALTSGSKSAFTEDSAVGTTVTGTITDVDYRQVNDFTTQQPAFFPSGDPKMQFIVRIQTDAKDDDDDDGVRSVYIPAWGARKKALTDAIRDSGAKKGSEVMIPGVGFSATYNGEVKEKGGQSGSYTRKDYTYAFNRSAAAQSAVDTIVADDDTPPAGFPAAAWAGMTPEQKAAVRAAQA